MQFLRGRFKDNRFKDVYLGDGRRVKVESTATGISLVRYIHDERGAIHAVVTPGTINASLGMHQAAVAHDEMPVQIPKEAR